MKGFFDTLPRELDESATMDGATHAQVVLPDHAAAGGADPGGHRRCSPSSARSTSSCIANVFLTDPDTKTLAVGLFGLLDGQRNTNFGMFAAGTLLTAIPTVLRVPAPPALHRLRPDRRARSRDEG